jgi:starch-binding outer membrane protein, SusD/RagB family
MFGDPATTTIRANPRVETESDPGDQRVVRDVVATTPLSNAGAGPSSITFDLYLSPTTPTPIMLNKELVLLRAEVEWGQANLSQALALANYIRTNDGGLAAKSLSSSTDILNQILYEKRFSLLWQSPDRWYDSRMFGKLNGSNPPVGLGLENGLPPLYNVPLPQGEIDARGGDLTKTCSAP